MRDKAVIWSGLADDRLKPNAEAVAFNESRGGLSGRSNPTYSNEEPLAVWRPARISLAAFFRKCLDFFFGCRISDLDQKSAC
jgi:hypothetical protein